MRGSARQVDVCSVLDQHRSNLFTWRAVMICFLVVVVEGYDISAMGFALPGIAKDWAVQNISLFGPVLAASTIGMIVGSVLLGWVGDRAGRRAAILLSCLLFALFTGLITVATTLPQLLVLRLIAGVGLGGAAPNAISLTSEFAPARHRSFSTTVMFSGIGFGGALPGLAAMWLMPEFGWRSLFVIGSIIPLVASLICLVWLPESPTYLVGVGRSDRALHVLQQLSLPDAGSIKAEDLCLRTARAGSRADFLNLFRHGLARPTLFFWLATAGNFMTFYLLQNWTPMLFTLFDLKPLASIGQTIFQFGGVTGGLLLGHLLGRRGVVVMAGAMLVSILPTLAIGWSGGNAALLLAAEFAAGFCILGTAYGFGALGAMIYPVGIRSNGVGCGLGAGRCGAVVSTIAAGQFVGAGMSLQQLLLVASAPLLISGFACLALVAQFDRRRDAAPNALQPAR